MITIFDPRVLQLPMPFDAKLCNYHLDTDRYHFKIETISEYLTRVDLYNRSMGMIVAIAVPKDGYSAGSFPIDQIETFSTHFKNKWYSFIEGIADENFIELPQTVVESGLGMDFVTGEKVDMGLPSTIDSLTENTLIEHSHTHKLGDIDISNIIITGGYGALYNFPSTQGTGDNSITSSDDWIIPTISIIEELTAYCDGVNLAGFKLREVGYIHWMGPYNYGATNEFGFNAFGSGRRDSFGVFSNLLLQFCMWSSTIDEFPDCYASVIEPTSGGAVNNSSQSYLNGYSIRPCNPNTLLENGQIGEYVGNDLKTYKTIVINGVEWVSSNINETKFRNGDWISGYDGGTYTPISNEDWVTRGQNGEALMCYYNDNEALGGDTNQTLADLIPTLSKQITESEDIHPVVTDSVKLYTKGVNDSFISKEGKFVKIIRGQVIGVYAPQLVFEYTSAATIPVGGNTIEFWNTQLNLPVNGTAFTDVVIVDNLVNLIGGSGITLISPETLTTGQTSGLVSIKDYNGCLTSLSDYCFTYESEDNTGYKYLRNVYSLSITSIGYLAFYGAFSFDDEFEFYFPTLTSLGNTVGFNNVFTGKQNCKVKLWVNPVLLTCNGGSPDGDIAYLNNVEINPDYNPFNEATYITKSDLIKEFQVLVAKDITPGTAQTYELILKAREALNVDSLVVECDSGTLTGCQLLIGSTAVSLNSATTFTISTTQTELTATSNYAIAAGNLVKLLTSTGYTGTPTTITIQLNYSKA